MKAPWPPAPPLAPRHEPAPLQFANPRGQGTRRSRALQSPRPTQRQGQGLPGACLPPAANPRASQDGGFARDPRDRVHTGHLTGLQLPRRDRLSPHKQPRARRALEAHRT
eukprot:scaffold2118_cov391-Prasinococcus_capsulatus_cf.AAC.2